MFLSSEYSPLSLHTSTGYNANKTKSLVNQQLKCVCRSLIMVCGLWCRVPLASARTASSYLHIPQLRRVCNRSMIHTQGVALAHRGDLFSLSLSPFPCPGVVARVREQHRILTEARTEPPVRSTLRVTGASAHCTLVADKASNIVTACLLNSNSERQ